MVVSHYVFVGAFIASTNVILNGTRMLVGVISVFLVLVLAIFLLDDLSKIGVQCPGVRAAVVTLLVRPSPLVGLPALSRAIRTFSPPSASTC